MKKSILTAAVTMALGLSSANVFAVVTLDGTSNVGEASTYASEVARETFINVVAGPVETTFGFGASAGQHNFMRFDLSGATFSTAIVNTNVTVVGASNIAVATGGAAGSNYVVFDVTADVGGMTQDALVSFALDAIKISVTADASSANLRYRLYANSLEAANGSSVVYASTDRQEPVLGFSAGLSFVPTANSNTAAVTSEPVYTQFVDGGVLMGPTAAIGSLALGTNAGILNASGLDLGSSGSDQILAAATKVIISGDFSAALTASTGKVWLELDDATPCDNIGTTSAATVDSTGQSAEAVLPVVSGIYHVCYTGDGATPFAKSSYTVEMVPVAVTPAYDTARVGPYKDLVVGSITRDGTELQATFASTSGAKVSRFNFLNVGASNAPITSIQFYTNKGNTTFTGAQIPASLQNIPAGGRLGVNLFSTSTVPGLLPVGATTFPGGATAGSVVFTIGASNDNIQGTYQLLLSTSDVQTVAQMVRPGTN